MGLSFIVSTMLFLCLNVYLALSFLVSKPSCPDRCGNVTIPYPFGIGSRCSAGSSFTITCLNSTGAPKPILNITKLEVLDISMLGAVVVNVHVSPLSCSPEEKTDSLPISRALVGTPYTISAVYNTFANVGCHTAVWSLDYTTNVVRSGCMSVCSQNSTATCDGVNCCRMRISDRLQEFRYTYKSIYQPGNGSFCGHALPNYQPGNGSFCGYAFPVETKWLDNQKYLYDSFGKDVGYVPLVLEWEMNDPYVRLSAEIGCYAPDYNNSFSSFYTHSRYLPIYRSTIVSCDCEPGFEGNPYLPGGGCSDIDECSIATGAKSSCGEGARCINTYGSHICEDTRPRSFHHNNPQIKLPDIVVGCVIGSLILLSGACWSGQAITNMVKAIRRYTFYKRNGGLLLEQHLASTQNGIEKTKVFTSNELSQATDRYNVNRILGCGGQGTVYKGMLADGKIVAVKKSKKVDEGELEVFINEVVILSQINHRNIVKLIGCCLETEVPLLVYEFIPNGTLFHHIHEPTDELSLTWVMRLQIATEVAGALAYLHSASSAPIYHRDIKSVNILLDGKYRAKVADFGTSRSVSIDQTHVTTRVIGTFGYIDPEYFQSNQFTEKSDVYSFGVVMVELLTGERAVTPIRAESGKSLATHFLHSMEDDQLFDILDSNVLEEAKREEIVAVAELARKCLHLNGRRRPTMREVAMSLEGIQAGVKEDGASPEHIDNLSIDEHYYESSYHSSTTTSTHMDTPIAENPLLDEEC